MSEDDWQRAVMSDLSGATAEQLPRIPAPGAPAAPALPEQRSQPSAHAAPFEPPSPVPALSPEAQKLVPARTVRGDSFARRTGRALRRLLASSAAEDVAEATRVAQALQQPITTGRQIVVTSVRGGAGKSTVAALLGTAYAHYRSDLVLMMEANPTLGTLPVRVGAPSLRWTIEDLGRVVSPSMRFDQVLGYLVGLPEGGWLLPGSRGQIGAQVSWTSYETVAIALRRYFAVTVVDCESLPGELARSAMAGAQARVLTAPATLEGVTSTQPVLEWMARLPRPMLSGTVVALVATSPHVTLDLAAAVRYLSVGGVRVVVVPYDRHLAGGGAIRMSLLSQDTHDAATRLAAEVLGKSMTRRSA